ncbi:hypothetical protein [Bacillus solitudinis]|uniref:hypothetical protein n=1 Tax=Bacillus solitudinis TaxID=2014074 RepID=UPI000C243579|nr:hypothetical protein [Bacillus solitudinis]
MNHISLGEWKTYARGDMTADNRTFYEQHLYTCDQCMTLYMEAVESIQDEIPIIEEPSYIDEILSKIPFEQNKKISVEKEITKKWHEEKVFHYVLAAAMTFVLMTSGVFSELTNVSTQFEKNQQTHHQSSFTENVLNKTTDLLGRVEQSQKEEANDNE